MEACPRLGVVPAEELLPTDRRSSAGTIVWGNASWLLSPMSPPEAKCSTPFSMGYQNSAASSFSNSTSSPKVTTQILTASGRHKANKQFTGNVHFNWYPLPKQVVHKRNVGTDVGALDDVRPHVLPRKVCVKPNKN